jgi:Xaa-Pro aminopeptidase
MKPGLVEDIIRVHGEGIDRSAAIPGSEYRARWRRLQAALAARGYDAAYACGSELDRSDVAWLAGVFDPIIERYGIVVPARGKPVVVAGSEGGHVLEDSVKTSGAEVYLLRELQISDEDYRHAAYGSLDALMARLVPPRPGRAARIAILSSGQFLPHDHLALFQGRFGADNVAFETEILRRLKYEKSPRELALCAAANAVADAAFLGMLAALRPGVRELDVAAVGDYIMKRLGAGRTGFPTIVSSGPRGRTVLGPATNRVIRRGEFVSLGISPTFNGYHGIMRRTVKVGAAPTPSEAAFLSALEGLYRAVFGATRKAARAGLPASSIDRAGKAFIARTKLRDRLGRRRSPREPYTFIHNTGCSECQEGFGAVTPYTDEPMGQNLALMIDVAFLGFDEAHRLVYPLEYAVIEDAFWKRGAEVGVYNRLPLNVQAYVGGDRDDIPARDVHPFYGRFAP